MTTTENLQRAAQWNAATSAIDRVEAMQSLTRTNFHFTADEEERAVVESAETAGGCAWEGRTTSSL